MKMEAACVEDICKLDYWKQILILDQNNNKQSLKNKEKNNSIYSIVILHMKF